ncbi:Uncharacterized protein Adt_11051 [Abeliophyllum distichum]|uniref:Uncharacterized protein n=1 Tax=Abeliophyllum distichum TaxID=126358 RepID=A0ABD1UM55_9LAMI
MLKFKLSDKYRDGRGIAHPSKFGHATGGGGVSGGQPGATGGDTNGDGSRSPYMQGGSAVIPVYAAGAANNHHNYGHNSGGDCKHGSIVSATLAATILECLLLYIYKDL